MIGPDCELHLCTIAAEREVSAEGIDRDGTGYCRRGDGGLIVQLHQSQGKSCLSPHTAPPQSPYQILNRAIHPKTRKLTHSARPSSPTHSNPPNPLPNLHSPQPPPLNLFNPLIPLIKVRRQVHRYRRRHLRPFRRIYRPVHQGFVIFIIYDFLGGV